MGVLDTMNAASPSRKTVPMCLDGAVQAEVDAIEASFQAALDEDKKGHGSLANPAPAFTAAVHRREELREQVARSQVTFVFERMPWTERVALQAEHPPRTGNIADLARGYNFETFLPALIRGSVVEVTDATGDTETDIPDDTWDSLLGTPAVAAAKAADGQPARRASAGSLNHAQVSRLVDAATAVNEKSTTVPPSALSLLASQDSGESSAQPSPGTSARAGGKAGSRPAPRKSATGRKPTAKKAAAKRASSARSASS